MATSPSLPLMPHYFSAGAAVTLAAAQTGETAQTAALLSLTDEHTHTHPKIQLHYYIRTQK